jgi:hypothetical protein
LSFTEKEFQNIFLLNGGIDDFQDEFPELVEGKVIGVKRQQAATAAKPQLSTKELIA